MVYDVIYGHVDYEKRKNTALDVIGKEYIHINQRKNN